MRISLQKTVSIIVLTLLIACFRAGDGLCQSAASPPSKIILSMGHSTLGTSSPDWSWLRKHCSEGHIFNELGKSSGKFSSLVIPVFDNGQCFYDTSIEPFKGRLADSGANERALRQLLSEARAKNVAVYLGVDVLGWQKKSSHSPSIFKKFPELQELAKDQYQQRDALLAYASPFNERVSSILSSLIKEIAVRFPEASGIVLDLRLSDQEMLGYSTSARDASIRDIQSDPVDLAIMGQIQDGDRFQEWINWRKKIMLNLLRNLASTYREHAKGQVLADGYADYYESLNFSNLRSSQDWQSWLETGAVDKVLLEGRWLPRFTDGARVAGYLGKVDPISKTRPKSSQIILAVSGKHLVKESSYQRDWVAIRTRNPELEQVVVIAQTDQDIQAILAIASGRSQPEISHSPSIGEIMPEWECNDTSGAWRTGKDTLGKRSMLIAVCNEASAFGMMVSDLRSVSTELKLKGIDAIVASSLPQRGSAFPGIINLLDNGQISQLWKEPTLVAVDKAGFVRRAQPISKKGVGRSALQNVEDFTPPLEVGLPAPEFTICDMNGKVIRLSEFRGKRNVLLTFFPKCFTGGCQSHLSSISGERQALEKQNTEVLAVSVDAADVQIDFANRWNLYFSLLPDTGRNLSVLYGAAVTSSDLSRRQSILIDKAGIVRHIDRNVNVGSHGPDIVAKIKALEING